jgi:hypothetical protein
MDLVGDGEAKNPADAGQGRDEAKGVGVVDAGLAQDGQLELTDDDLVVIDEGQIGSDAVPHARVLETLAEPVADAAVRDPLAGAVEVVLVVGDLDVSEERAALTHAQVRGPVPAVDALDRDDEVLAEGMDREKELLRIAGQVPVQENDSLLAEDADVHRPRVQVDPAIVLVLLV